jgi:hypothetical protein
MIPTPPGAPRVEIVSQHHVQARHLQVFQLVEAKLGLRGRRQGSASGKQEGGNGGRNGRELGIMSKLIA